MKYLKTLLVGLLFSTPLFSAIDNSTQVQAFVERFYITILERESDASGLADWSEGLISGTKAGEDLARGFVFSTEFINRNLNNDQFVIVLYQAFFNREPDSAGFTDWKTKINSTTKIFICDCVGNVNIESLIIP